MGRATQTEQIIKSIQFVMDACAAERASGALLVGNESFRPSSAFAALQCTVSALL